MSDQSVKQLQMGSRTFILGQSSTVAEMGSLQVALQHFVICWQDAPKLPSSGSSFRLPFPVPSASINGRILSGLDLLERSNGAPHCVFHALTGPLAL